MKYFRRRIAWNFCNTRYI